MTDDRFAGETAEPPVVLRCDYCGGDIRHGYLYYVYEEKDICLECSGRFAWCEFETLAKKRLAGPEQWL